MRDKLVILACAAALAACGGDGDRATGPASMQIGSSVQGFAPLVADGVVSLYRGPQGGFHVYLGIRASGVRPGRQGEVPRLCDEAASSSAPCVDFEVFDLDQGRTLDAYVGLRLPLTETTEPGTYELVPPRLVQLMTTSFEELEGHRLRVTATLEDADGRHLEQTVEVTCVRSDS